MTRLEARVGADVGVALRFFRVAPNPRWEGAGAARFAAMPSSALAVSNPRAASCSSFRRMFSSRSRSYCERLSLLGLARTGAADWSELLSLRALRVLGIDSDDKTVSEISLCFRALCLRVAETSKHLVLPSDQLFGRPLLPGVPYVHMVNAATEEPESKLDGGRTGKAADW